MKRLGLILFGMIPFFCISAQVYDSFMDARDSQVYKTVKIGSQWWMAENINATSYPDNTPLEYGVDYFWYDNDFVGYPPTYGTLYTWSAAMNGAESSDLIPSGVQGICPDGWHLPSDSEWKEMEMYLGMDPADINETSWGRGTDEGNKLKEPDITHWSSPNTGANNSSGFTALPGGLRSSNGHFLPELTNHTLSDFQGRLHFRVMLHSNWKVRYSFGKCPARNLVTMQGLQP